MNSSLTCIVLFLIFQLHDYVFSYSFFKYKFIKKLRKLSTSTDPYLFEEDSSNNREVPEFNDFDVVERKMVLPVVNSAFLDISLLKPFGTPCNSTSDAMVELKELITEGFAEYSGHFRLEYVVKWLESKYVPIHTPMFYNLAHSGEWRLIYSSLLTPNADPNLNVSVFQSILPNELENSTLSEGRITNKISWGLVKPQELFACGDFYIHCDYKLTPTGALAVSTREHILEPDILPESIEDFDVENLILSIQRSVPFNIFDPEGTVWGTSFIDPNIRISRVLGEKYPNIVNIFQRI